MKNIVVAISLCLLIGCASKEENLLRDAAEFSAISFTSPKFSPKSGKTFAWYSPVVIAVDTPPGDDFLSNNAMLLLNAELVSRGYKIVEDKEQADYVIGAAIVGQNNNESTQLTEFFRLFPSIRDSRGQLDYATAFIGVIDSHDIDKISTSPNSNLLLWRSSIRAFVVNEKVNPELREQRLQLLASKLMKSLP